MPIPQDDHLLGACAIQGHTFPFTSVMFHQEIPRLSTNMRQSSLIHRPLHLLIPEYLVRCYSWVRVTRVRLTFASRALTVVEREKKHLSSTPRSSSTRVDRRNPSPRSPQSPLPAQRTPETRAEHLIFSVHSNHPIQTPLVIIPFTFALRSTTAPSTAVILGSDLYGPTI